jgi:hypothetical protein
MSCPFYRIWIDRVALFAQDKTCWKKFPRGAFPNENFQNDDPAQTEPAVLQDKISVSILRLKRNKRCAWIIATRAFVELLFHFLSFIGPTKKLLANQLPK